MPEPWASPPSFLPGGILWIAKARTGAPVGMTVEEIGSPPPDKVGGKLRHAGILQVNLGFDEAGG